MSTDTVYLLIPEIVLVLVATAIYVGGAFSRARDGWTWLAMAGLLLSAVALSGQTLQPWKTQTAEPAAAATGPVPGNQSIPAESTDASNTTNTLTNPLNNPLIVDLFSQSARWLILAVGFVFVLFYWRSSASGEAPELIGSLLLIVAGLMIVALASDLVLLFVGLELVSIPTYVVLYLGRTSHDAASQEATVKYFFLSILSSALLLYGFSFLYGAGSSTSLFGIYDALSKVPPDGEGLTIIAGLALVLIFAGLGFRITAVPFHFYAPDVYQGTSHANAALLAVAPKIAGFTALVRIVAVGMPLGSLGWHLALGLSVLTMTVGNLLALWQNNIRRMLAYSSIAHSGYMLIGLAVGLTAVGDQTSFLGGLDGLGSMFFYLIVYILATVGSFAVLSYLSGDDRQIDDVDDLAGVGRSHPRMAAALAIFMFSLTGLPPLAGFFGKFTLFLGALGIDSTNASGEGKWFVGSAIAGSINAAIAAAYYLRVVGVMFFRSSLTAPAARRGLGAGLVGTLCVLGILAVSWNPSPLIEGANQASQAARATFASRATAAEPNDLDAPQVSVAVQPTARIADTLAGHRP